METTTRTSRTEDGGQRPLDKSEKIKYGEFFNIKVQPGSLNHGGGNKAINENFG